jgi:hypothetical protein
MLAEACARAGFSPKKIIRIAEWTGKSGYAAAGLGVALVPSLPPGRSRLNLACAGSTTPPCAAPYTSRCPPPRCRRH